MTARPQPPVPHSEIATGPTSAQAPTPPSPANGGSAPALSAEHYAQLAAAHLAYAPIRRAMRVAMFSASTLALFAVLSMPFALFSLKGAFAALGLAVTAVFEFRGRAALGRLEVSGVQTLVWNQIALTGLMTVYCLWSIAGAWFGPDQYAQIIARNPELGDLLAPYADLFRQMTVGIYGIVLIVGLLVQALVIRYYATRRRHVEKYLAQTPAWILAWNRAKR